MMITKRMNDINTVQATSSNELILVGADEYGEDFTIVFDATDFLSSINKDTIEYIKENAVKYINNL